MIVRNNHHDGRNRNSQAALAYDRLRPRLEMLWETESVDPSSVNEFELRLQEKWPELFAMLLRLYGNRWDFFFHLEQILLTIARGWIHRPLELRVSDEHRILDPNWFLIYHHQRRL